MPSRNMAYDHPAYTVPQVFSSSTTAGANGISQKFAAFTNLQLKAALMTPNIASTSASQPLLYVLSGTTTTTTTLTALTSAARTPLTNQLSTALNLNAGDQFYVTHGTDATTSVSVAFETYLVPGANVTA